MADINNNTFRGTNVVEGSWDSEKYSITLDGAFCVKLVNKTGADSAEGNPVSVPIASDNIDVNGSVKLTIANGENSVGIVQDSGVADGETIRVAFGGLSNVLLKNNTSCVKGEYAYMSDTIGRVVSTPTKATAGEKMLGVFTASVTGGTDILAPIIIKTR